MPVNDVDSLFSYLSEKIYLDIPNDIDYKTKEIIFSWMKAQKEMTDAMADHNDNFLNNETIGYLDRDGAWVDAGEFSRGRDNSRAFSETIKKQKYDGDLLQYASDKLSIDKKDMFESYSLKLANRLVRINNLYLKGDKVNIDSMLDTTIEGGAPDLSVDHASEMSIFDTDGKRREGRYYIQGSSDRMIVNRAQDILLGFVSEMEEILDKKAAVPISQANAA